MKKNELAWRELVDAAITDQQRKWDNVEDLAFQAGIAPTTAAYALKRPIEIGAVQRHSSGFTVVNPGKVLTLLCAARSVVGDLHTSVTLNSDALDQFLKSGVEEDYVMGGCAAAISLLGGVNTVSDYSQHLLYLRDSKAAERVSAHLRLLDPHSQPAPDLGNVTILVADARAARKWRSHASFAQTYADLFATPGWQASEFRHALHERYLSKIDWDQV